MRLAIIDLGTNSVRFDVHQLGPGRQSRLLHREKLMVRLGQGVFLDGKLDAEAQRRTLHAFESFSHTCTELGVDRTVAFGTSALREASDGGRLLEQIKEQSGIEVRVISGAEEARWIARGILAHESGTNGKFALIDIGGGSTEISICRGSQVLHSESFPLGTARLQQVFLKASPPAAKPGERDPVDALRVYLRSVLLPKMIAEEWPKVDRVIGSSGTIKALEKLIEKDNGLGDGPKKKKKAKKSKAAKLTRDALKDMVEDMSGMNTAQLLGMPGMESKRVDMILAGGVLFEECLRAVGAKRFSFTPYALRDGILEEEMQLFLARKDSHISAHLGDLEARARKLGCQEAHFKKVADIASFLFDKLRGLHKLGAGWKVYLTAAAILHDTGEAINPSRHGEHAYYVIRNADFPSLEKWEIEFLALLARWHSGGKVDPKALQALKGHVDRRVFLSLLALLRVADALDRGHRGGVLLKDVRVARQQVTLILDPRGSSDLEMLRVEQKRDLFEETFGRRLVAERGRRRR